MHKGYLRIVLLPWNCILLDEHCETLEIEARVVQQSLITRQLSLELGQLGLEWARVDFSQQVSGTNELAFLIPDTHQLPVDLSLDCHSVERGNRAEAGEVDGDGTGLCCYCGNRDALRAGNRLLGMRRAIGLRRNCSRKRRRSLPARQTASKPIFQCLSNVRERVRFGKSFFSVSCINFSVMSHTKSKTMRAYSDDASPGRTRTEEECNFVAG